VVPFFFDYITKVEFGVWLAVSGVVALITMADLGVDQYLTTVTSNDDKFYSSSYADYISSALLIKIVVALIITVIATAAYFLLTQMLDIEVMHQESAKLTFVVSVLTLVLGIFFSTISTILYARHHYTLVNAFTSLFAVIASLSTLLLLSAGYGMASFPLALLFSLVIRHVILFLYLVKKYPSIKLRIKSFNFINRREFIGYATSFQVLKWVHTLRTQYIAIAINNLAGPIYLTQYNLTNRLPQTIPQYAAKIVNPFFPSISDLFHKKDFEEITIFFFKMTKILFRVAILSGALIFITGETFIDLWVGGDKFAGSWVMFWIVVYMVLHIALGFFGVIIFSSKRFEKWVHWSIFEVALAILLSYILNIWFGFSGIVSGVVIASLPNQYYLFHIVLRQLAIKKSDFIKGVATYALVPNIIPIVLTSIFYINYTIDGWLDLATVGLLTIVSSLASWEVVQYYLKRSLV